MNARTDIDPEATMTLLLARREELRRLAAEHQGDRQPLELDQTRIGRLSRMDALQMQAMSRETDRRRGVEIGKIDKALGRLAAGDYGYCVNCGEEIALERLEFDPATLICIDCASAADGA